LYNPIFHIFILVFIFLLSGSLYKCGILNEEVAMMVVIVLMALPVIFVVWIGDFVKDIQNAIINQIIELIQFNLTHIGDVN